MRPSSDLVAETPPARKVCQGCRPRDYSIAVVEARWDCWGCWYLWRGMRMYVPQLARVKIIVLIGSMVQSGMWRTKRAPQFHTIFTFLVKRGMYCFSLVLQGWQFLTVLGQQPAEYHWWIIQIAKVENECCALCFRGRNPMIGKLGSLNFALLQTHTSRNTGAWTAAEGNLTCTAQKNVLSVTRR